MVLKNFKENGVNIIRKNWHLLEIQEIYDIENYMVNIQYQNINYSENISIIFFSLTESNPVEKLVSGSFTL